MLVDVGSPERPDPYELATRFGVRVLALAVPGLEGLADPDRDVVWLDPNLRRARGAFALLHEVGHLVLGVEASEAECQRFAASVLLPAWRFRLDVQELGLDLRELAKRWPWASMEALARRCADLEPGVAAAKWDSGWTWRTGPDGGERAFREAAGLACSMRLGTMTYEVGGWTARAWRVSPYPQRAVVVGRALPGDDLQRAGSALRVAPDPT